MRAHEAHLERRVAVWIAAGALVLAASIGCDGDDGPPGAPALEDPDAGPPDAAAVSLPRPTPPALTPCPEGWEERRDQDRIAYCEPWPEAGPVRWACPEGWTSEVQDGLPSCEPPSGGPVRWACPPGWREERRDGVETCAPYPVGGPSACGSGSIHLPGESGCRPVGDPCPAGDFPEGLPRDAPVVWVLPGATGGDGTGPDRPLGRLADLDVDALPEGAILALGRGTHVGGLTLRRSLTVWGACAEATEIRVSEPGPAGDDGVLRILPPAGAEPVVTIRNLGVGPSAQGGLRAEGGGEVRMRGVLIEGTAESGLIAIGGVQLDLEEVVIRGTEPRDGRFGRAIELQEGARLEGRKIALVDNRDASVILYDEGTEIVLEDLLVDGTRPASRFQSAGAAFVVRGGTRAVARRALLAGSTGLGVFVTGGGALELEDVVLRDTSTGGPSTGTGGRGMSIQSGGSLVARRALLEGNQGTGIFLGASASGGDPAPTQAELEDVVIRGHRAPEDDPIDVSGLEAFREATVEARRLAVLANQDRGILISNGSVLRLEDALVRDTEPSAADGQGGRGLTVQRAEAEVRRTVLERNREVGVIALGPSTQLSLEDAIIRGTESALATQTAGIGLAAVDGATVEARRLAVDANRVTGVDVQDAPTRVTLEDAWIRGTRSEELDGSDGVGVTVLDGGELTLRRVALVGNRNAGLLADRGGRVEADGLRIDDTLSGDDTGLFGRGIALQSGSTARVRRLHARRTRETAVLAYGAEAALTLEDAVVEDTVGQALDDDRGSGVVIAVGARATIARIRIDRFRETGVTVTGPESELEIEDALIREGADPPGGRVNGQGMTVEQGATARVARAHLLRTLDTGFRALLDATATLTDTLVRTVRPAPCVDDTPACASSGSGLGSAGGARVVVERSVVADAYACGLFVFAGSAIEADDLLLEDNDVGACFEDPLADPSRIRAVYRNNREAIELVNVPPPPEPLPEPVPAASPSP